LRASLTPGGGEPRIAIISFGVFARFARIVFSASATSRGGVREAELFVHWQLIIMYGNITCTSGPNFFKASATSGGGTVAEERKLFLCFAATYGFYCRRTLCACRNDLIDIIILVLEPLAMPFHRRAIGNESLCSLIADRAIFDILFLILIPIMRPLFGSLV
jgi:hypothetical protein